MTDPSDPGILRQCAITEEEFSVILDHHRQTMLTQAYEIIALRTHSTMSFTLAHLAAERLHFLDQQAWQSAVDEIKRRSPVWHRLAEAEAEVEDELASLPESFSSDDE